MNSQSKQSSAPYICATLFMIILLIIIYYEEIVRWLYTNNLWFLPIQLK